MPAKRVLQLVGDAGGHLAERREPVAQPLAFLELLDLREVLEEHHRADRLVLIVPDLRERVADHAVEVLQPQLGAIRQMAQLEGASQHADDVGPVPQHVGERASQVVLLVASSPKMRYASSFISATCRPGELR